MKHIKLFEAWDQEDMNYRGFTPGERKFATCFQGDAYAAVGILDDTQHDELQGYLNAIIAKYPGLSDISRIERIDVTGMEYVLHDVNGEFTALPAGAESEKNYLFHIGKSGENIGVESKEDYSMNNYDDRLFDLIEGALLSIDHHGYTERISVGEFAEKYIGS